MPVTGSQGQGQKVVNSEFIRTCLFYGITPIITIIKKYVHLTRTGQNLQAWLKFSDRETSRQTDSPCIVRSLGNAKQESVVINRSINRDNNLFSEEPKENISWFRPYVPTEEALSACILAVSVKLGLFR